jgi:hypothetical protein
MTLRTARDRPTAERPLSANETTKSEILSFSYDAIA